jgi:putative endonuclease
VYIVASLSRTIYVGMTNDLARRMHEHRTKAADSFTARYSVNRLVWYEVTGNVSAAIAREKQIKAYSRNKKIALIEAENAGWNDLAEEMGLVAPDDDSPDHQADGPKDARAAAAPEPRSDRE